MHNAVRPIFSCYRLGLIHNGISEVQLLTFYENLGQNAAFLRLPHGNLVPGHPKFDLGIDKNHIFTQFPGLFSGKCTPEMPL